MKSNPEESLRRALAEFADETGLAMASDSVRLRLKRELRARVYRRRALTALAAAAALAAVLFGVATRMLPHAASTKSQTVARQGHPAGKSTVSTAAVVPEANSQHGTAANVQPDRTGEFSAAFVRKHSLSPKRTRGSRRPEAAGDWRKGEVVLSPWYYNTALPPAARSVLVRSEVDARTAMRFGVVSAGDKAPVEILFGEDGLPRAMRFVHSLPTQSN